MAVSRLVPELVETFAVSFGVVLGGALLGALASLLAGGYPARTAVALADRLKVWGAAAALGGTLVNWRNLETGLLRWQVHLLLRELALFSLACAGGLAAAYLLSLALGSSW
jgi:hypothetical protein